MPESNESSAEFCRGAVAMARTLGDSLGEEQYRALLAVAEAREGTPGDSLSTTVEKLREACSGVRVEPKPDAPTAAEELEAAKHETEQVTALYDEAHEKLTIAEGEIARLNDLLQKAERTAAEVIEACRMALEEVLDALRDDMPLDAAMAHGDTALALIAKWKEVQ